MKIPLYNSQSVLKQRVMVSASKGSSFIFIVIFVRFTRLDQAYNSIIKLDGFSGFFLVTLPGWFSQFGLFYCKVTLFTSLLHANQQCISSILKQIDFSLNWWGVVRWRWSGLCVLVRVSPVSGGGRETNEIRSNAPVKILQIYEWPLRFSVVK